MSTHAPGSNTKKPRIFRDSRLFQVWIGAAADLYFPVWEPLSVPQMAAMMFLSPNHFATLFTRECGATPAAYLRRLRLERAQTLLRTSDLSILEITRRTGFRNVAQFSRAFHAVFNTSPTAYRATFQPALQPRKCPLTAGASAIE